MMEVVCFFETLEATYKIIGAITQETTFDRPALLSSLHRPDNTGCLTKSEISGSHGGKYEDGCLLGPFAV
jgi:hypothetical protein